jgi:hypothetical protein
MSPISLVISSSEFRFHLPHVHRPKLPCPPCPPVEDHQKPMSSALKDLRAKDLEAFGGHGGHKCPKPPIGEFLSLEHVSAGCPLLLHVLRCPISPCCRSPLDPIQRISPSSASAALLATGALSCAQQGAGCHMIPERGREAATVPSCASGRARARKGRADRQQVGGRSDDGRAEPVPVAPAAPETREGRAVEHAPG